MDDNIPLIIIFVTVILSLVVVVLFFATIITLLEFVYGRLFHKPFFVHFYWNLKSLSNKQYEVLFNEFHYFRKLSRKKRNYFEHRTATFIENYEFVGKNGFEVDERVKVLIAATSVMLTFGMRRYLYKVFDKIIVYPGIYYSQQNQAYHKGEFNPMMKAVVFSWEHFEQGLMHNTDNINLGLHEFAHVLNFQGLKSEDASSLIFARFFKKITEESNHKTNRDKLLASTYFRDYAYTNEFEFLAVILEHFFETPKQFKSEFPELFRMVKKMINYRERL